MWKWAKALFTVSGPNHDSRYGETPEEILNFFENLMVKNSLFAKSFINKFEITILQSLFKLENIDVQKVISNSLSIEISGKFKFSLSYDYDDEDGDEFHLTVTELKSGKHLCSRYYHP